MTTASTLPTTLATQTATRTPINPLDAQEIIEHVNEDHVPELLLCVRAFTPVREPVHAQVTALYASGFELNVTDNSGTTTQFIPYGEHGDSIRAVVGAAREKLGVKPDSRLAHWKVLENRVLTRHFRRLVLDLQGDTRTDWRPGYACRFDLPSGEERPYTLRRLSATQAEVDVYCHDDTPGSQWAAGLKAGDPVTARGGRQESFPPFNEGAVLLLGDETALPTIAALLESWADTVWADECPVRVLLEVGADTEQRYLDDVRLPRDVHVRWLPRIGQSGASLGKVLDTLETPPHTVWGALEASSAKQLRKQLQAHYPQAKVRITGYWRANNQH